MAELLVSANGIEVWHGDSLDPNDVAQIMGDRRADLLCVDAPYSETTHAGHRGGKITADRAAGFADGPVPQKGHRAAVARYAAKVSAGLKERSDLDYAAWSPDDVRGCVELWSPLVSGWHATITDDVLAPTWRDAFDARDLYTFAPLPWVEIGSRVRMTGDGPSCWTCWVVVARPKTRPFSAWGTLPGAYVAPAENAQNRPERITGGKSLQLMCRFISDYSKRGQLVVDPCLGGGTTAIAARMTGRRCIGVERDRERAELCARLVNSRHEQASLF